VNCDHRSISQFQQPLFNLIIFPVQKLWQDIILRNPLWEAWFQSCSFFYGGAAKMEKERPHSLRAHFSKCKKWRI